MRRGSRIYDWFEAISYSEFKTNVAKHLPNVWQHDSDQSTWLFQICRFGLSDEGPKVAQGKASWNDCSFKPSGSMCFNGCVYLRIRFVVLFFCQKHITWSQCTHYYAWFIMYARLLGCRLKQKNTLISSKFYSIAKLHNFSIEDVQKFCLTQVLVPLRSLGYSNI